MTENVGAVEVTAKVDTSKVGPELSAGVRKAVAEVESEDAFKPLEDAATKAGHKAGQNLGNGLIVDAQGRVREAATGKFAKDTENAFAAVGKKAGKKAGDEAGKAMEKSLFKRIQAMSNTLVPPFARTIAAWIIALGPAAAQLSAVLVPAAGLIAGIIPVAIGAATAMGILKISFKGVGKALKDMNGPTKTFQADLKKLGPGARAFVMEIKGIQKPLKDFRNSIQEAFFGKFAGTVTLLVKTLLPKLKGYIVDIAGTLGSIGKALGQTLAKPASVRSFQIILAGINADFKDIRVALMSIVPALLTIGQKVTPLVGSLADQFAKVAKRFGDFVDKASKTGRLDNFFASTKEALGLIYRIGKDAYDIIASILDAGKQAGGGGAIVGFLDTIAGVFKDLAKSGGLAAVFKVVNSVFADLGKVLAPLIPPLSAFLLALSQNLGKDLKDLTPALINLVKNGMVPLLNAATKNLPAINSVVDAVIKLIGSLTSNATLVKSVIAAFIAWWTFIAVKKVANLVLGVAEAITTKLIPAMIGLDAAMDANPVGLLAAGLVLFVGEVLEVVTVVNGLVQKMGGWKALWEDIRIAVAFAGVGIRDAASSVWKWLKMVGGGIVTFGKSVGAVAGAVFDAIPTAINAALNIAGHYAMVGTHKLLTFVRDLPTKIEDYGIRILKAGVSIAKSFVKGLVQGLAPVAGIAKSIYGALKGYLNSAISGVNASINKVAGFLHISAPNIPRLAQGALVTKPTVAMVGEAGPEVVAPLNNPRRAYKLLRDSGLAAQLGTPAPNVHVTVMIGAEKLDDRIDTRIEVSNDETSTALAHGTRGF